MWPSPGRCSSWPRPPEARPDVAAAPAPIRIGYCLSLTGSLADNGRSARLAHEIWHEEINARGGLLGRPVEFVRYDDQGDVDLVHGIYERLIDEDRVDLVIGGYGTNTLLPAMSSVNSRTGRGRSSWHRRNRPPESSSSPTRRLSPTSDGGQPRRHDNGPPDAPATRCRLTQALRVLDAAGVS
ncbi:ABC transporter substrate-binding protein [Streptomyces sp. NPDC055036]